MSESSVNPDEFVGEPPAGDAAPQEFMSNDQSDAAEDNQDEEQA
jgi:hypothetical protein